MGNNYIVEERKTDIKSSCEVLVAGGGIAGIAAAIAAALPGCHPALMEQRRLYDNTASEVFLKLGEHKKID